MPPERDPLEALATGTSRRGFLARTSAVLLALAGSGAVLGADAEASQYTNFCGHTWTTGNCPHPTGLPRVDRHGFPLRARDGHAVDDLGRPVNQQGRAVDEHGRRLRDPDGVLLPIATRTKVCVGTGQTYGFPTAIDGSWHRCCGGHVRKMMDCCAAHSTRINGDAALDGYCYTGRKVFCVTYFDTSVPC